MAEAAEIIGSKQAVALGKTYGVTEIVGSSGDGLEKAIRGGLDRAATLRTSTGSRSSRCAEPSCT
jgi:hypothetical protein